MKRLVLATIMTLLFAGVAAAADEGCKTCHDDKAGAVKHSAHAKLKCATCHEGAAEHLKDASVLPTVHFDLEICGKCHKDQYDTYTYSDDVATKFGGSAKGMDKKKDFANYNDIVDGHGFTKEYNRKRDHVYMLTEHYNIKRGKFDTCLQCKSTKAAYYWNSGKELTVKKDVTVKAGHMKDAIIVPKGTKVSMSTDFHAAYPNTDGVRVVVILPDGTKYGSVEEPGITKDTNWTWSAIYALTVEDSKDDSGTFTSGNGCNHCHDPHNVGKSKEGTTGFRVIRKAELEAIARGGLNPYKPGSAKSVSLDKPLDVDSSVAICAQCHVEYVCGVSGVDKIDRDFFPWAKAADLEASNHKNFPGYGQYSSLKYVQDWKHGAGPLGSPNAPGNGVSYKDPHPIMESLTKSQHPEAETYWNSPHYGYGAKCYECHMPKVEKKNGKKFTSHWLTSPYKYAMAESAKPFAKKEGLKLAKDGTINPCIRCHKDAGVKYKDAKKVQDEVYAKALVVQDALVASLAAIKDAKDAKAAGKTVDSKMLSEAIDDHREAHTRWENLVVSENSMGFHNPPEVMKELDNALKFSGDARTKAMDSVAK